MKNIINDVPNGSLVWKMGKVWGILPPDKYGFYYKDNIIYTNFKPACIIGDYFGKGSFKRSLQIIGTSLNDTEANINIGWVNIHLFIKNDKVNIDITGGKEAVSKRWAMGIPSKRKIKYKENTFISHDYFNKQDEYIEYSPISQREQQVRASTNWQWLRSEVYIRDKGICWVCNEFVLLKDYDLGHIVERSNGGRDSLDNCAVMHRICNGSKPRHVSVEEASKWRLTHR